jgi:predicted  nucleic acid-binding Zn-ribbon protein
MRDLESTITSLTSVVEFNEGIVKGEGEFVAIQPDDKNPTEELGPAGQQSVVCWTCGSKVERADIRDRLDDLRDLITDKRSDLDEVEDQITNLQGRKREIESEHEKRRDLERKYERTERRLKEKRTEHQELEKRMSDLRETVDTLETEAAEMEELRESDILERYEELSSLEFERGQLEQQLAEVESEIEEIGEFPDLDELEAEREQLVEALAQERQRIDHIETEVVENFNHHMEMILDLLEYENIARIWLEKQTVEGGRGRSATTFDLHIVREDVDGAVYEDTSEHLSESEKEVLGLVVTLSGYLAHNTYDVAPVILLDSLEAIDSERIARLIEYFAEYATYVVTALLHEDAQSLSDAYQTIPADALR